VKSQDDQGRLDVSEALRTAGLQVTVQRLAVYEAVEATPHAMADEISQIVKSEIGVISKQAVYDALNGCRLRRRQSALLNRRP